VPTLGLTVGAAVAVNSVGSTLVPGTDRFLAGPQEIGAEFGGLGPPETYPAPTAVPTKVRPEAGANTTIATVATDAALTRAGAERLAVMAHAGLARAVRPVWTPFDGDTVFALATGARRAVDPAELLLLGAVAADVLARAIARGVYHAGSLGGVPGYGERTGKDARRS
ncbi:MAG: P1 family peptidase, partial [Pseudomonadota bacterium]